jgi:DNA repair protein RecO (recombination protein O)
MKKLKTRGIILSRTDFSEADRILTFLTPDYGKLRVIAKGVRKIKSKMAGGIELLSVSDIGFIRGRGEISTLVSTRLIRHYEMIVKHLDRTMAAYEFIKQIDRLTEDEVDEEYFLLLEEAFGALNEIEIDLSLVQAWFAMQILRMGGRSPNLYNDTNGDKLSLLRVYDFDFSSMAFIEVDDGKFNSNHIKLLRLGFEGKGPSKLRNIEGINEIIIDIGPLAQTMLKTYIQI